MKLRKRTRIKLKELKKLFDEVNSVTDNLKNFNPSLLVHSPESLIIFRLLLGMSQKQFARELGKHPSTIDSIERKRWNFTIKTANIYMQNIKEILTKWNIFTLDFEKIKITYENFYSINFYSIIQKKIPREFMSLGGKIGGNTTKRKYGIEHFKKIAKIGAKKGGAAVVKKYGSVFYKRIGPMTFEKYGLEKAKEWGRLGGLKAAKEQKLNKQEKQIKKILEKLKINFEVHSEVKGKKRNYILDFVIPNSEKPRIVIEATRQGDPHSYGKVLVMSERIKNIKKIYPNVSSIAIIPSAFSCECALKLSEIFDCVMLDEDKNTLYKILTKHNINILKEITANTISKLTPSKGFQDGGIIAKQIKREPEELKVENKLRELGISFTPQAVLSNSNGLKRIVDFAIPSDTEPKTIIEVTKIIGKSKNTHIRTAQRLKERFLMLKHFYCPKSRFIALVDTWDKSKVNQMEPVLNGLGTVFNLDEFSLTKPKGGT